jgi:hypothetical protein
MWLSARIALASFVLAGCASPILDRNGNPVDTRQGITVDQAPDVGPRPSQEEVMAKLGAQGKTGVSIRSMRPVGFGGRNAFGGNGRIVSGWLVCYTHKSTHLLTRQEQVLDDGMLLQLDSNGQRTALTGPGPTHWCKSPEAMMR